MKQNKTLYFESAGMFNPTEYGEMNSCRIRTAFSLKNGKRVYFEGYRWTPSKEQVSYWNNNPEKVDAMTLGKSYACVDMHYITDEIDANGYNVDDCNKHRISKGTDRKHLIEWTKSALLSFVNSLGAKFSAIEILPNLAGYRVHADIRDYHHGNTNNYNYGDEFIYDKARTEQAEKIKKYFYDYEKNVMGKRYPNNSVYFENGVLKVTIPYNCYNDRLEIPDVFAFDFNYQRPNSELLRQARLQRGINSNKEWLQ